jgi:hypothetical protein
MDQIVESCPLIVISSSGTSFVSLTIAESVPALAE